MAAIVEVNVLESLLQLLQLGGGLPQQALFAVNACALFHRRLHLLTDGGWPLAPARLMQELGFESLPLVCGLRLGLSIGRLLLDRKLRCRLAGPRAKDEALGQKAPNGKAQAQAA